ncbi:hypothetical protein [Paraburkholderia sp. J76]|uniref:hypothetical protein n=1 Tax=Paraburkholderia sp. J76 TaxID=2805439 RepID=UPI002ABDEFE2|nr:hypothetical protein [Paraburkholderia sp. J76]
MRAARIGFTGDFRRYLKGRIAIIGHIKFFSKLSSICPANRSFESGFKPELINLKNALTADQCAFYMADCHRFVKVKN